MREKAMSYEEMLVYLNILADQVKKYNPDEIIGVSRSGMPYATWISQMLDIKHLGYLNLANKEICLSNKSSKRVFIIDDNVVEGRSYIEIKKLMLDYPHLDYKFGVLFTDNVKTPYWIKEQVIKGVDLDYFATSVPGIMKVYKPYVRSRDASI
jgi:hypoxanthine phosphoribosyltransferase